MIEALRELDRRNKDLAHPKREFYGAVGCVGSVFKALNLPQNPDASA